MKIIIGSADLESCLREAKYLGLRAQGFFRERKFEQALQVRLEEITLLERAYDSTPESDEKNGKVAGYLGQSYSSAAKTLYRLNEEDVEYLQKAREIFKVTFDAGRLPAFAYDTCLFVLRKLCRRAETPEEKLPYARDYVSVLVKATREGRCIHYKNGTALAKDLLPGAIMTVVELERQLKPAKVA